MLPVYIIKSKCKLYSGLGNWAFVLLSGFCWWQYGFIIIIFLFSLEIKLFLALLNIKSFNMAFSCAILLLLFI